MAARDRPAAGGKTRRTAVLRPDAAWKRRHGGLLRLLPTPRSRRMSTSTYAGQGRTIAGHSGYVDPSDPAMGTSAWAWNQRGDSRQFRGRAPCGARVTVSGLAPASGTGMDSGRL